MIDNEVLHSGMSNADNETVKTSCMAGNLNRLSKLQKSILTMAYNNYCNNTRLPHTGIDRSIFPSLSFADIRAGLSWDESWPEFNKLHLYTTDAVAFHLGINFRLQHRHGSCQWFQLSDKYSCRYWASIKVDSKQYNVAQASIYRAFKRLDERKLIVHYKRASFDGSGIKLTESGIDFAKKITGIKPKKRSWE
jgi:hypothetical protein